MNTLTKSSKNIPELVREHIWLFDSFDHVYIFGSVLDHSTLFNDIDIMVIYTEYSGKIGNDLKLISDELGKVSGVLIDLTALSIDEVKETTFLEKIKSHCLKIK